MPSQAEIIREQCRPTCVVCGTTDCQISPHGSWICTRCYARMRDLYGLPTKMTFPKRRLR